MKSSAQKQIDKYFPHRSILFQPGLALALDSVTAALLLGQLLYWHEKGKRKDGWVYKTMQEMREETGLSRTQQETAIKRCRELEVLEYKIAGIPAKRHFKINMPMLEKQLPVLKKNADVVYPNPPSLFVENPQTNTENTQKTTSQNTHRNFNSSTSDLRNIIKMRKSFYGSSNSERIPNDFDKKAD